MSSDAFLLSPATDILWYRQPATRWAAALPLGNGRMGAMVFGGIENETIVLSEATCWSGEASDDNIQPGAADLIAPTRQALSDGEYVKANALCEGIIGEKRNYGTNLPTGRLTISLPEDADSSRTVAGYRRQLRLDRAIADTGYVASDIRHTRTCFVSQPHQVLVLRLQTDQPGNLSFQLALDGMDNPSGVTIEPNGDLLLEAHAYESIHSDGQTGVRYQIRLRCLVDGGSMETDGRSLRVNEADAVTVLIAIASNYGGANPEALTLAQLDEASQTPYQVLVDAHVAEHRSYYSRARLDLGSDPSADLPTDERLAVVKNGATDPALTALMFHYGRYLLLCSSRPDSPLPAHLQGAWNDNMACRIGWTCDYHLDVNTQMNYWPAEVTNLTECSAPLFDWIETVLVPSGRRTARELYGHDGWVAHIFSNAWGFAAPGWSTDWGLYPAGGLWIAMHLWDHYCFTQDRDFLVERAYPLLREAARFFLQYLSVDPDSGYLLSGPSISPENVFTVQGQNVANSMGATGDTVLIRSLFTACIDGSKIVGEDEPFLADLDIALAKLPPFQIGAHGQLQEWLHDFPEPDLHHRHTSHLLSLYPFGQIDPDSSPELAAAAKKSIDRRMTPLDAWEDTGWARSLLLLYAARLWDGEAAEQHILSMQRTLADANLFVFHPSTAGAPSAVYELDGNTGLTSGIAEMLLQSHVLQDQRVVLHLLPALPSSWRQGRVTGLCARGSFTVHIAWSDGVLTEAVIHSNAGQPCRLRYQERVMDIDINKGQTFQFHTDSKMKIAVGRA